MLLFVHLFERCDKLENCIDKYLRSAVPISFRIILKIISRMRLKIAIRKKLTKTIHFLCLTSCVSLDQSPACFEDFRDQSNCNRGGLGNLSS